jgi:hypothetical protein
MGSRRSLWYYVPHFGTRTHINMNELEDVWEALLSGDAARIRRAWDDLTDEEALSVLAHLGRMRDEDGWSASQREAATIALQVLRDQPG